MLLGLDFSILSKGCWEDFKRVLVTVMSLQIFQMITTCVYYLSLWRHVWYKWQSPLCADRLLLIWISVVMKYSNYSNIQFFGIFGNFLWAQFLRYSMFSFPKQTISSIWYLFEFYYSWKHWPEWPNVGISKHLLCVTASVDKPPVSLIL